MGKTLVIVESPAKAKTIGKYLGKEYLVEASVGHVKDLPTRELGVDIEKDFNPSYEVIKGKKKIIDAIKSAAKKSEQILLAPDPDREGEAIAWHIAEELRVKSKSRKKTENIQEMKTADGAPIRRVLFNEITKKAILEAIKNPVDLDQKKFEAQQARRILDRIVGYKISPLLWDKVRRGLSAGRVQSVAVRLVCEREDEIKKFVPEEYWNFEVDLEGSKKPVFVARLDKKDGKKFKIVTGDEAQKILSEVKGSQFKLIEIQKREQRRHPTPPFITSKLQQEAARKLGFTAKKTMTLAQRLYEGIEIDGETVGLITYMRTDSVRVSDSAISEVRQHISATFGKAYLPENPNLYKTKKDAQNAHEAIRPTSLDYTPERVQKTIERDMFRLYELIWKRFVASQMTSAIFDSTVFVIDNSGYEFRASGSILKFAGFIKIYQEDQDESQNKEPDDDAERTLPDLKQGEILKTNKFSPSQHFTQPPPRYTEASLVKELEEKGIGRPSTYASILSTIVDKAYVEKFENKFRPTYLGAIVNDLLVEHFPKILDVTFTAGMEEELDEVEEGKRGWVATLKDFYKPFVEDFDKAVQQMPAVKARRIETDIKCSKCQAGMVIRFGRNGEFLACSQYPECRETQEFKRLEDGKLEIVKRNIESDEVCEKCGKPMVIKSGKFGRFLACSGYPDCKSTKAISLGVNCPDCGKPLSERRTKRGKVFFGCTGYPNCKFASWDKPVDEKCPECDGKYLVEKITKTQGSQIKCPNKECDYARDLEEKSGEA